MAQVIIDAHQGSVTPSSGTVAVNIPAKNSVLHQFFINPATSNTTYDAKLTDIYSRDVYVLTGLTGKQNNFVEIPSYGNWTLTITNASVDEAFDFLMAVRVQ